MAQWISVHFAHAIRMVFSPKYKLKGLFLASEEIRTKVFKFSYIIV